MRFLRRIPARGRTALVMLLIAAILIALYWFNYKPPDTQKTVRLIIYHSDGTTRTVVARTKADSLRSVIEEYGGLFFGIDTEYGLRITIVDGEEADTAAGESWQITKRGNPLQTAIDTATVSDGDVFEFKLHRG